MTSQTGDDISEEVLEEGCYYLSKLGLDQSRIAAHFQTTVERVSTLVDGYARKLNNGEVEEGDFDRTFWEDVKKEAEGDLKVTFVSEKGFHHAWKSELSRLDGRALMSIYESSKDFVNSDPNQKFLDFPPPKGYDPLAMDREIKKAVAIIEELMQQKWNAENPPNRSKPSQT